MSKSSNQPEWTLSDDWAVKRDPYNWCLMQLKGNSWRSVRYYPTPQMLLESLHEKISLTMPAETDLINHLEVAFKLGDALSSRLSVHISESLGDQAKLTPQHASAILEQRVE